MSTPFQEPLLNYDPVARRWEGENEEWMLWMDEATFDEYVMAWAALHKIGQTPQEWVTTAAEHCRHLYYWNGCEGNYDRRVHLVRKPLARVSSNLAAPISLDV